MKPKSSKQRNFLKRIAGTTMPIMRKRIKWGRNWLCICNSGKKYKNCCLADVNCLIASDGNARVADMPEDIQRMVNSHIEAEKAKEEANKKVKENGGVKQDV